MGQMILMVEVDLTVPKQQSHSHTGNENKSKQPVSQRQSPPSGDSHWRPGEMHSSAGSLQL